MPCGGDIGTKGNDDDDEVQSTGCCRGPLELKEKDSSALISIQKGTISETSTKIVHLFQRRHKV